MNNIVVLGVQYGDEGKARFVDQLAVNHDFVIRFNGGANAGHTVVSGGKTVALRQIPAGVFYPGVKLYIGSGCMVNLVKLVEEIEGLRMADIEVSSRLYISARAGVIQPHHLLLDGWLGKEIGTTGNGIGPAYADRCYRMWQGRQIDISFGDLVKNRDEFFVLMEEQLKSVCKTYSLNLDLGLIELGKMKTALEVCEKFVVDDPLFIDAQLQSGKTILGEGAQSVMLDVAQGTTPYVTSSSTIAAALYTGGDVPIHHSYKVIGVAKAIMSRVGNGPFASEVGGRESEEYCMAKNEDGTPKYTRVIEDSYDHNALIASDTQLDVSKALRHFSGEYGVGTKRPRRIGALDLVQLKYAIRSNSVSGLILTKCDLLNLYSKTRDKKIPLVTGYKLDGKHIDYYPSITADLAKVTPEFTYLDSFTQDISGCKKKDELPKELHAYLDFVEAFIGCKIHGIGTGPDRDSFVSMTA